eukprot:TRINITY_DN43159_c0_g1_i1.p1 TRINITY_DN43159_c0_g1~~TRINITY_DN43159_c0_g1_i1.p1  ORF type:complete len:131 (-),score=23.26 TRINITY_DN43159_c0_g1_i1:43-435(-)
MMNVTRAGSDDLSAGFSVVIKNTFLHCMDEEKERIRSNILKRSVSLDFICLSSTENSMTSTTPTSDGKMSELDRITYTFPDHASENFLDATVPRQPGLQESSSPTLNLPKVPGLQQRRDAPQQVRPGKIE